MLEWLFVKWFVVSIVILESVWSSDVRSISLGSEVCSTISIRISDSRCPTAGLT